MAIRDLIAKANNEELAGPFEDLKVLDVTQTISNTILLKGGDYNIRASRVGANSLSVQLADPDDEWLPLSDGVIAANDTVNFKFPRRAVLRMTVSVNTPNAWISTIKRS